MRLQESKCPRVNCNVSSPRLRLLKLHSRDYPRDFSLKCPFSCWGKKIFPPPPVSIATVPKITNCTQQSPARECRKCCWDTVDGLRIAPFKKKEVQGRSPAAYGRQWAFQTDNFAQSLGGSQFKSVCVRHNPRTWSRPNIYLLFGLSHLTGGSSPSTAMALVFANNFWGWDMWVCCSKNEWAWHLWRSRDFFSSTTFHRETKIESGTIYI